MDPLANAMNSIKVAEKKGKQKAVIKPASKVIREILILLQKEGFIGEFESLVDGKSGEFIVKLQGQINNCGVVRPSYSAKTTEFEKYEQRYLPAQGIGALIVSTNKGITTHTQALKENSGGKILAYVY